MSGRPAGGALASAPAVGDTEAVLTPYSDGFAHIVDHLRLLDRRIEHLVGVVRWSARQRPGLDARNHVFVSDQEVDRLLAEGIADNGAPGTGPDAGTVTGVLDDSAIAARVAASVAAGVDLRLEALGQIFGLTPFERDAVVICLAPEIDRRYDRLYAYLQDDATRKRPSVDLILRLLCDSMADRWPARAYLAPDAPLRRSGILHVVEDPRSPSGSSDLAQFLRLDDRIRCYLHRYETVDDAVSDAVTVLHPADGLDQVLVDPALKARVSALVARHLDREPSGHRLLVELCGPVGVGRRDLAAGVCGQLGCSLTYVDAGLWTGHPADVPAMLRLAFRECLLHQGAVYVDRLDELLRQADQRYSCGIRGALVRAAAEYSAVTFLGTEAPMHLDQPRQPVLYHTVEVPRPGVLLREAAWRRAMARAVPAAEVSWAASLAAAFTLTPGQITTAADEARLRVDAREGWPPLALADLYAACRQQYHHQLGDLGVKMSPARSWTDLILPAPQLDQLRELCAEVRHRDRVLDGWGFGRMMSRGRGISALLVGVPGTGKTMAAEVVAAELGMDLLAIDLSGVVSKYIGETEKNLSRIFQAAGHSNAILFFDEADALFGKRTEVSDAHDRYANIETSFLLQRMEQYDGVVMLATNLRENLDEAFTRRLRFIVEFPFPEGADRAAIWRAHFPAAARIGRDVDVDLLARQYPLSGAGIRNAALTAAFAAAADGSAISLAHIRHGIRREYEKVGKLWTEQVPVRRQPIPTDEG